MSGFEYVTGLVSVLVGLALADLAVSLQRLLRAGRRVRWDLLTPLVVLVVALNVVHAWWNFHALFSGATVFELGRFLPHLGSLLLLFLLAATVLPDEVPADGLALADHYRSSRLMIWSLLLAYATSAIGLYIAAQQEAGEALGSAILKNGMGLMSLPVLAIPLFTRNRGVHAAILVLLLASLLFSWVGRQIA